MFWWFPNNLITKIKTPRYIANSKRMNWLAVKDIVGVIDINISSQIVQFGHEDKDTNVYYLCEANELTLLTQIYRHKLLNSHEFGHEYADTNVFSMCEANELARG